MKPRFPYRNNARELIVSPKFHHNRASQMMRKRKSRPRKWNLREGVATIEFAVFLPVLVLVSFGSIQLSNTILLRHQNIALLEAGALDYMLGQVGEDDLAAHIITLTEDAGLVGASATVNQVDKDLSDGENNFRGATFLELSLSLPIEGNVALPIIIQGGANVSTSFEIYRPETLEGE